MSRSFIRLYDIAKISFAASILVVSSWVAIPVGAVPVTLQTFAVLVAAGVLGAKKGTASVLVYLLLGFLGLPVFSGFQNAYAVLFGATGGFVLGFLFVPAISGVLIKKTGKYTLSFFAGILCCYLTGVMWYMLIYLKNADVGSVGAVLSGCVLPFVLPDIIKCLLASAVTKAVIRRGDYDNNR